MISDDQRLELLEERKRELRRELHREKQTLRRMEALLEDLEAKIAALEALVGPEPPRPLGRGGASGRGGARRP